MPLVIIPARLDSARLPRKPLALIKGVPMVVHVMHRAQEAAVGPVYVACCGPEIADVVEKNGGKAIITDPHLPSGTDRVFEAAQIVDPTEQFPYVINVQGDLPFIPPSHIQMVCLPLSDPQVHVSTVACPFKPSSDHSNPLFDHTNPSVVKIALGSLRDLEGGVQGGRAVYFSRNCIPFGADVLYHHIGLYAYKRSALKQIVGMPPSRLENLEKLEQLRALEAGFRIDVAVVQGVPQSVDTPEDLHLLQQKA